MPGRNVIVVGGGAAGIIAAWRAAQCGARVTLLEKTPRLGTKILISGGGKCNITHAGPLEEVLRSFRPNEARFIRPACYRFTNEQVVDILTSRGLEVYTRPDGRIFPVDKTAKDVVAILRSYLEEANVDIRLETPVVGLLSERGEIRGVQLADGPLASERVVVSVGGSSYPNSGTTGEGWKWLRALGHTVVKVRAALAPIYLELDEPPAERAGVALRDCVLKARLAGKEIVRWRGDLLFTHHGVSGPTVLGISRVVAEQEERTVTLEVDLAPDCPHESLVERFLEFARSNPKKTVRSFVDPFLAQSLLDGLANDATVELATVVSQLDKKSRNRLIETLKGWKLGQVRHVPLEKGEVVAGGISLDEVDPQTMESRLVQGLYLCGEVLDIAGPVGGYNLQAAFATGYVAGETAAGRQNA